MPNQNKICLFLPFGDGGISHYTFNLVSALSERGIKVILFTTNDFEFSPSSDRIIVRKCLFSFFSQMACRFPGLKVESLLWTVLRRIIKFIEYPFNILELLTILYQYGINLVHIQSIHWIDSILVWILCVLKIKIVYTIHNVNPLHKRTNWFNYRIFHFIYRKSHALIIHTHSGKCELLNQYRIDKEKIHVIPHGNYKFFLPEKSLSHQQAKLNIGIQPQKFTILFFGALRSNKGLDQAIKILSELIIKDPDYVLMIVGEPVGNYDIYKKLIKTLKLGENIFEYLDYVPNEQVHRFFEASDIVLLPYKEITQSGVLQIAYAFGKPVVATDLNGFRESIIEGRNGLLYPKNEIKIAAKKIGHLKKKPILVNEMGQFSKSISGELYSWDTIASKTRRVYANIIG